MNYKIKIAGAIALISIFLLTVTACEDAEVGPTTYNYICVNGEVDPGNTTIEGEQRCISCNEGFIFASASATCFGGYTCQNGTPAPGLSPTGEQRCTGCNTGYTLDAATSTCFGEYACLNGTPTPGLSPIPGAFSCERCDDLYTLTADNFCEPTVQFVCPGGVPVDGPAPAAGMINCQSCRSTHRLLDSVCVTGIRLVGGSSNLEGRVEIFHSGQWGTVCDDAWGTDDATVVCRELGFSAIGALPRSFAAFGSGTGPIWLDQVDCAGTESRLINCPANQIGVHDCSHFEDAGVICNLN